MEQTPDSKIAELKGDPANRTVTEPEPKVYKTDLVIETIIQKGDTLTYRSTNKGRKDLSRWKYDYSRLRRVCRFSDGKDQIMKPIHYWFWPDELHSDGDNSASKTEGGKSKKMKREDDRYLSPEELKRRVYVMAGYLREKYQYCAWCGFSYDDEKDLEHGCPGIKREQHLGYSQSDEDED